MYRWCHLSWNFHGPILAVYQVALWTVMSVRLYVRLSVCQSVYHTSLVFSNLPVTIASLNFHESLPLTKVIYELALLAIYDDQNRERYNFNNTRNIHCRPIHEYFFLWGGGGGGDLTLLVIGRPADTNTSSWKGTKRIRFNTTQFWSCNTSVSNFWETQAMCSGLRGCHCNMYQRIMSVAKRADIENFWNCVRR